jgi:amino acid adenylation domain-containing protein
VPVDPTAPASRNGYILSDCGVRVAIVEDRFADALAAELGKLGAAPALLRTAGAGGGSGLTAALGNDARPEPASGPAPDPDALAYVLYTSGSTGRPKGVMLTHRNALAFIDWCSETFRPEPTDRFSSHAPFHFDLSILDVFVSLKHGATLVLIGDDLGKDPARLARFISEKRISIWYSAPSILTLLGQYGRLDEHDYSALRAILFAGEVFPVKHLRRLKSLVPHPRYFNLYGPTETNVCTYYELPAELDPERTEPYPIGATCSHLRSLIVDEDGRAVAPGREGELCISGPAVTRGYWNLPENNARAFLPARAGGPWYRTGDVVVSEPDGNLRFLGRRDRMVKRRGYRVELGEIEACLYRHPDIEEAAVVATESDEGLTLRAFVASRGDRKLGTIALKRFCAGHLARYMIPDSFTVQPSLPKTSTGKVDYQKLKDVG